MISPVLLALGANLSFSTASIVYAEYSKKYSPKWMNLLKALVAFSAFSVTVLAFGLWEVPSFFSFLLFMASGATGLMLGDLFLLRAYTLIGPARTLMIFGFSPIFLGVTAYFLFDQKFEWFRLIAIVFLILCLFTFSIENYKRSGNWQIRGLILGFLAVALDSAGLLMTRAAFDHSPAISSVEGNMIRALGAVAAFILAQPLLGPYDLKGNFLANPRNKRILLLAASLGGTYVSLMLYLTAVKTGHLASISAVAITAPLFAALLECFRQKKWPSAYLSFGLLFFGIGFFILFFETGK
ncbi:MAG: EamA family transporter [Pseudobdellovibrionaceae bacterium]